ncbi:hypothetical protein V8E51_014795 [Hyaloscypha variabilis]|uniref:Mid2 domain-containing protein n=1 Tax=Hyaloscypha variabilis (strain UAMH 11265 / GT02V1 / F) TaxID=1149755 RepID=A0A2J6RCW3_HYAVF|nr:hypothetical protein L207DRAFT_637466 [Hyaloscypha variabilis F]
MIAKRFFTILLPLARALPWDGPQVTATAELGSFEFFRHDQVGIAAKHGWNPVPTAKPGDFDEGYALRKRSSAAFTFSTTGDTCGYLDGAVAFPQTCSPGYTCAIATAQNVWACCPTPSACQIATSCVPQSQLASCAANAACPGDNYVTKCDSFDPYCNLQIVIGEGNLPATLFYCDSIPSIETIYATATDAGTSVASGASFVFVSMTIPTASASPTTTPTPSPTPVIFSTTSTSASSTPTPTHNSSSTPVGAIVGGTIGGVAVLIAIAFGIFFILRSRKKNNAPPSSEMQQGQFSPQSPTAGYGQNQPGNKQYYQGQASPVSPYSPPGSPPIGSGGSPEPQYYQQTPPYHYSQGPSEVEGTAIHR